MIQRLTTLTALFLAIDTEQTRQKTALIEAYATCLKVNVTEPERCHKPAY
jgi:hypothetical protein